MPDDQQAHKRGDRSPLQPRNLRQQMECEEYFPRKVETYHRSGPPTTSIVAYDHLVMSILLFYKEGVKKLLPGVGLSHLTSKQSAGRLDFDQ